MLKFLKNTEIDISLWDECISRSSQSLIYGLSWYLDIIAPQWCAIVKEVKGKYIIAMPLTVRNKLGVNYIFQPVFAQQLGLFSVEDNTETMVHAINYLKEKFILINYNFNIHNTPLLKSTVFAKFTKNRVTHILLLDEKYQTILDKYSATNKRNIKKGLRSGLKIIGCDDLTCLLEMFRKMRSMNLEEFENHSNDLVKIFKAAKSREQIILHHALNKNNDVLAAGFFLIYQRKITYVLGASTKEGRELGAMNLIIDEIIKEYAGQEFLLDFEGGEAEGIGKFYKSFGGQPQTYLSLDYHKLSFK